MLGPRWPMPCAKIQLVADPLLYSSVVSPLARARSACVCAYAVVCTLGMCVCVCVCVCCAIQCVFKCSRHSHLQVCPPSCSNAKHAHLWSTVSCQVLPNCLPDFCVCVCVWVGARAYVYVCSCACVSPQEPYPTTPRRPMGAFQLRLWTMTKRRLA